MLASLGLVAIAMLIGRWFATSDVDVTVQHSLIWGAILVASIGLLAGGLMVHGALDQQIMVDHPTVIVTSTTTTTTNTKQVTP